MSFAIPDECFEYVKCATYDCEPQGNCVTDLVNTGPNGFSHNIKTDYSVLVGGIIIPVYKTVRSFSVQYKKEYGSIKPSGYYSIYGGATSTPIYCIEKPDNEPYCRVIEECIIERSILCYIDKRYGICLYKYIKHEIYFDVESYEECLFKEPWQVSIRHQIKIKDNDYTCYKTEEWRLVIDGADMVLSTTRNTFSPFPDVVYTGYTRQGFVPDLSVRQVLVFPQPPSQAMPWSDDVKAYGFYDYGNLPGGESELNKLDGGNKDMFYPEWCRNLQQDPFWRKAADNRYNISWFHTDMTNDDSYTPSDILTDPTPKGSYVDHPVVGEVYQFLTDGTVTTSPDFDALVSSQLALVKNEKGELKGLTMNGTSLYYPIGVI